MCLVVVAAGILMVMGVVSGVRRGVVKRIGPDATIVNQHPVLFWSGVVMGFALGVCAIVGGLVMLVQE
jgi:hypothetical protein